MEDISEMKVPLAWSSSLCFSNLCNPVAGNLKSSTGATFCYLQKTQVVS